MGERIRSKPNLKAVIQPGADEYNRNLRRAKAQSRLELFIIFGAGALLAYHLLRAFGGLS